MLTPLVLFVGLTLATAVIAYWSDNLGKKLGKKRVTLWNLRPRTTATILTIASSWSIMLLTLLVLLRVWSPLREALFRFDRVRVEGKQAEQQAIQARTEALAERENVREARLQTENARKETETQKQKAEREAQNAQVSAQKANASNTAARLAETARNNARRSEQTAKRNASSAVAQKNRALGDLNTARTKLATTRAQFTATRAQLSATQTQFSSAKTRLSLASSRLSAANARLSSAQSRLNQTRLRLNEVRNLESLVRKTATTLGPQVVAAQRQVIALSRQVLTNQRQVDALRTQTAELQTERDNLEKQTRALQRARDRLAQLVQVAEQETSLFAFRPVRINVGRTLVARTLPPELSASRVEAHLRSLLRSGQNVAPDLLNVSDSSRSSIEVSLVSLSEQTERGPIQLDESAIFTQLSQFLSENPREVSVRLVAARNVLEGETAIPTRFEAVVVERKIEANQILAQTRIEAKTGDAGVFRALLDLIEQGQRAARERGVNPPQSPDQPDFYENGTNEQLFEALREVQKLGERAQVQLIAAEDLSSAEPLRVRFNVKRAGEA